ncbi:MAG: XRE family transcriptional regulator [Oscillospiraceae bacterium]|nr:XRE family transcriptional regulator [Oscillospiraceae bacterium]
MEQTKTTPFGKEVKKRLVDLEQKQAWLIEQVKERTGLFFDGSYLYKVMTGQLNTPNIVQAIREILDIPDTPQD